MSQIIFGDYTLDVGARLLQRSRGVVHLEPKVMDLLLLLVENAGRCVPKAELRARLWPDVSVGDASLTRLAKELRKALCEDHTRASFLRTVHGRGYQFVGPRSGAVAPCPADEASLCVTPGISRLIAPLRCLAGAGLPIVVEGETGTGKTCVARAIHHWSQRPGPLQVLHCADLTENQLELAVSEARRSHGTLLLDELAELPAVLQRRLLARLSNEDAGDPTSLLRCLVVTSQRPLSCLVLSGALRVDLLARVDGSTVQLPPLRRRREDVPVLARYFLERAGAHEDPLLLDALGEGLAEYHWPFNVRELEMRVLRWLALQRGEAGQRLG
jgi:transcriptional regulator of acetoin/glycerol metabolism